MKNLLGILVLGLLWCGNVTADQIIKTVCQDTILANTSFLEYSIKPGEKTIYADLLRYTNAHGDPPKIEKYINNLNIISWKGTRVVYSYPEYKDMREMPKVLGEAFEIDYGSNTFIEKRVANNKKYLECKIVEVKGDIAKKPEGETEPSQPSPDDDKVVAAASGSGFFVSKKGHIVTNHHVIDQCKAVKVNYKADEIPARIIAVDKTNDLAILQAKINPSKVYAISKEDVSLLEDIIVAGFPLGKKVSAAIKTHKGSVTALAGYEDNYSNFQTDATINQGNSGGPIINQKGNVVGVAVATWVEEGVQGVHFGVKSSTLNTFAKANSVNFLPQNNRDLSNAELGKLITEATVYLECFMTVAKIKQMIAQAENRKAFYSEHK